MRHQTREYGEATHSAISLSMLRVGRMEKYRRTMLPSPVRSPEGWSRPPADTPLQPDRVTGSVDLFGSERPGGATSYLRPSGSRPARCPARSASASTRGPCLHPSRTLTCHVDGVAGVRPRRRERFVMLDRDVRTRVVCTGGSRESRTPRRRAAKPSLRASELLFEMFAGRRRSRRRRPCGGPRRPGPVDYWRSSTGLSSPVTQPDFVISLGVGLRT
jgi:hypothetical protein